MKRNKLVKTLLFMFFLIIFLNNFSLEAIEIIFEEITINCSDQDKTFATELARNLIKNIEIFQKRIGVYPDLPVNIVIAENERKYLELTQNTNAILEFSEAFYKFQDQTIYIRNPRNLKNFSRFNQIILHEYIHHFIYFHFKNAPLWFHEGMAVLFSEGFDYERKLNFIKNYILGNSLPLSKMKYVYPDQAIKWESFYAKSTLAVRYLYSKKKEQFYNFWDNAKYENDFDKVFFRSFYFTQADFSIFFEDYAEKHFRIEFLLASSTLIWGVFPIIFLLGLIRRKIKNRKIVNKWDSEFIVKEEGIKND